MLLKSKIYIELSITNTGFYPLLESTDMQQALENKWYNTAPKVVVGDSPISEAGAANNQVFNSIQFSFSSIHRWIVAELEQLYM